MAPQFERLHKVWGDVKLPRILGKGVGDKAGEEVQGGYVDAYSYRVSLSAQNAQLFWGSTLWHLSGMAPALPCSEGRVGKFGRHITWRGVRVWWEGCMRGHSKRRAQRRTPSTHPCVRARHVFS